MNWPTHISISRQSGDDAPARFASGLLLRLQLGSGSGCLKMHHDRDCMVAWNIIRQCRWHWMVFAPTAQAQCLRKLAREAGLSDRRFIDVFRSEVGLNPKLFNRIERFQRVLEKVDRLPDPEWDQLALEHGYFDQSHLIRGLRAICRLQPSQLSPPAQESAREGLTRQVQPPSREQVAAIFSNTPDDAFGSLDL